MPLASRTVFQMDQTASSNKVIFWDFRKCRKDPNLDRGSRLCTSRDPEKEAGSEFQPLHNITDFKCHHFREYPFKSAIFG